jgi:hypothetical protein
MDGPRKGKFNAHGTANTSPAQQPVVIMGTFIQSLVVRFNPFLPSWHGPAQLGDAVNTMLSGIPGVLSAVLHHGQDGKADVNPGV